MNFLNKFFKQVYPPLNLFMHKFHENNNKNICN